MKQKMLASWILHEEKRGGWTKDCFFTIFSKTNLSAEEPQTFYSLLGGTDSQIQLPPPYHSEF